MASAPPVFEIPFSLDDNLLCFEGRLPDGQILKMTLDTCAWPHVVRTDLARARGWLTGETELSEGVGGSQTTEAALIPRLGVGGLTLKQLSALGDPLAGPLPLDVMLGAPLLRDWVVDIDYANRLLRLHDHAHWESESIPAQPSPAEIFPLHSLEPGLPALANLLALNGQIIPLTLLDTGNNASIVFSSALAESLGLIPATTVAGGGFGGTESHFGQVTVAQVRLGSRIWNNVQAIILPPESSPLLAQPDRALIGNALLKDSRVVWSLPTKQWLISSPKALASESVGS